MPSPDRVNRSPGGTRSRPECGALLVRLLLVPLLLGVGSRAAAAGVPSELLERAMAESPVRVIAELAVSVQPEGRLAGAAIAEQRARIADTQSGVLADLAASPHRVTRRFRTIPFVALEVSAAALARLAAHGLVRSVQEDVTFSRECVSMIALLRT